MLMRVWESAKYMKQEWHESKLVKVRPHLPLANEIFTEPRPGYHFIYRYPGLKALCHQHTQLDYKFRHTFFKIFLLIQYSENTFTDIFLKIVCQTTAKSRGTSSDKFITSHPEAMTQHSALSAITCCDPTRSEAGRSQKPEDTHRGRLRRRFFTSTACYNVTVGVRML